MADGQSLDREKEASERKGKDLTNQTQAELEKGSTKTR
jgi:hypothetical protein